MAGKIKHYIESGQMYGRLTIIEASAGSKNKQRLCKCRCACGTIKKIAIVYIATGRVRSCGCYSREITGDMSRRHGMSKTQIYATWIRMWARCTNPIVERYPLYGGRGIRVCDRWRAFENFFEDMGHRPSPKHSIGRINNDGNYEPNNCRWETPEQQQNNTSVSAFIEWHGRRQTIAQWSKETGIRYETLRQRRDAGMEGARLFDSSEDGHGKKSIEVDGERKLTTEWMQDAGIPISSFYHFQRKGLTPEQIVKKYKAKLKELKNREAA